MGLKWDILNVVFGSLLTALFLQVGFLSQNNPFWDNTLSACVIMIASRALSLVFGGKKR
jgi:hypothetical protein